jgi:hypothetical protein
VTARALAATPSVDRRWPRVLRWTPDGYLEALSASAEETVRAEPFDAVELALAAVLGIE